MSTYAMASVPGPITPMPGVAADMLAATDARRFVGMVHPDTHPLTVEAAHVRPVHLSFVPAPLREHAAYALNDLSGGQWWTVGEFRYRGEGEYDTAVARRVLRDGCMAVEYGLEC